MALTFDTLDSVFPLADFIADAFGPSAEIVVHDVHDMEASIIHIRNGELSGRTVGDGTTDTALSLIQGERSQREQFVAGYAGKSMAGRTFRSSTFFVKNSQGELIGLLCVNLDTTGLTDAVRTISGMLSNGAQVAGPNNGQAADGEPHAGILELGSDEPSPRALEETLQGNAEHTLRRITRDTLAGFPAPPERLSRDERKRALSKLKQDGVFLMKHAVPIVADELHVSTPTLYKYLQEISA